MPAKRGLFAGERDRRQTLFLQDLGPVSAGAPAARFGRADGLPRIHRTTTSFHGRRTAHRAGAQRFSVGGRAMLGSEARPSCITSTLRSRTFLSIVARCSGDGGRVDHVFTVFSYARAFDSNSLSRGLVGISWSRSRMSASDCSTMEKLVD